jgi:hypothetical protein
VIRARLSRVAVCAVEPALVCLLGLPATVPLWASCLPRSFDGLFHLFRLLQLDHLTRELVVFPRWAPDLLYGYGYPVFNYVPHLPYYVSDLFRSAGLSLVHTILLSFGLALLASGVAMYVFARDVFGSKAAIVSSVAYMYAPFHLYDMLFRGHLPGAWAMVLYPLMLWSFRRLIRDQSRVIPYFISSALLYAGSFLSHNPAHLIFTPFLLFYLAFLVWRVQKHRATAAFRAVSALAVGAGLAAFFWIPALWDRQSVQLERMITPPDLDYHSHFITLSDLLALPGTATTGLMNPEVPNNLGPVLVALSILSMFGLWRLRRPEERAHLIIALFGLAGVVFMVLPQSAGLWNALPLLEYLVFPHRFLRLACLVMAILAGSAVRLFVDKQDTLSPSFAVTMASAGLIIVSALSLLYPPYYAGLSLNPTFADMMEFERTTGTMGTTSFGEYLPVWVDWIPRSSPLEPLYASSSAVERLEYASLPEGAHVEKADYGPLWAIIELDAPQPFEAVFNTLYFPGWQAYVDGQKAETGPTTGSGLTSLWVPSGRPVVELRFEDTPVRTVSKAISALSIAAIVLPTAVSRLRRRRSARASRHSGGDATPGAVLGDPPRLTGQQTAVLAAMGFALLIVKIGVLDRLNTPFKREFDGLHATGVQTPLQVNFGDQITLLGYDLLSPQPHPGDSVTVTLYWKPSQQLTTDYSVFVHLVDEDLNIYAQRDSLNPGRYPTRLWRTGEYNEDSHEVLVPPGTPPGDYLLGVGLYDQTTMVRLPIQEEAGHEIGMYFLQPVKVTRAERQPRTSELGMQHQLTLPFDNGMTLLGYTAERDTIVPGDYYRLALFWRADTQLEDRYSVVLRLLDSGGEEVLSGSSEPSAGRYPTNGWEEGEIVRDNRALWVPRGFAAGEYTVELTLLDSAGGTVALEPAAGTPPEGTWLELLAASTGN